MHRDWCRGLAAAAAAALLPGAEAAAHGFAGDRFFPATILTDDPFVASEMSLPTVTLNPTQSDGSRELDLGSDLSMAITPKWDFTIGSDWAHIRSPGLPVVTGRTGNIAVDFPVQTKTNGTLNPNDVFYGFAVEYSIPYLQSEVKDIGLGTPFNRMIPLVEFALTSPFNRGYAGTTTGTVQPGMIWAGQYFQVGAEMIIPTNSLSGHGIGGVVQLHFYLDDLFPHGIGRPITQW